MLLNKETFNEMTIEEWYLYLEGKATNQKTPLKEVYSGIPRDITEKEMVGLLDLFKEKYGKELVYKIHNSNPIKVSGIREKVQERIISVRYKD